MSKRFNIKVYDKDGVNRIATLNFSPTEPRGEQKDEVILSAPKFNAVKNGGLGACNLEFNVKIDDFGGLESVIVPMNEFRIYEITDEYPLGKKIYSGFLDSFKPRLKQGKETTVVKIFGYASALGFDEFRTAGGSSTVSYSATDPGQMARDIITRAAELYPQLNFDSSSIPLLGWTTDYDFDNISWKDALDLVQQMAGTGYYWYVDQENKVYLLEKSSSAEKEYTIGYDVQEFEADIKTGHIKNRIIFKWSGGTLSPKTDATSIDNYGQRTERVDGSSVTSSTAADIQAQYYLDSKKEKKVVGELVINSRATFHDIRPGQTVKVLALKEGQALYSDNMQIENMNYTAEAVKLQLEEYINFAKEVAKVAEVPQKF